MGDPNAQTGKLPWSKHTATHYRLFALDIGSLSSGCNTPDPLSPSMVEKVDTLEVNTRPSTPTDNTPPLNADGSVAANFAATIKNRRRTSSANR